jgi:DNA invertase Pin-like site-specific DNA recombinase
MKCCILARVSTEGQSLESQLEKLINEAHRMGYTDNDITVISGKESGVKLDIEERQTIQQMKECIGTGQYNMVLIWEVSRLARRPKVLYEVREYLIERNVNLRCMTPSFTMLKEDGTIDPTASIVFALFGTMAEEEARLTKERMQRGVKHAKSLGKHAGGAIMFGYTTTKDHYYIIDEQEATIVKRIFNEYVYGSKSMRKLARDLQEEGFFKGIKFLTAVQEIYNILHHDCYCGRKKGMPAIISEDLYDKSVEKRKNSELKVNHTDNMALCKGILRDGKTGFLLSSNTAANMYYSKRASGVAVGMHIIEPVIWDYAVELHRKYRTADKETVIATLNRRRQMNERKNYTLEQKIKEIMLRVDKVEERLIMGKISESKADELEAALKQEANEYKARIREILADNEQISIEGNKIFENGNTELDYDNMDKEDRYEVVHSVIEKVILSRSSRYELECEIHNKLNSNIYRIRINTYKKTIRKLD